MLGKSSKDPNNEKDPRNYKRSETSVYVKKEKFANYVYDDANREKNNKLGNTSTGDGYKYRGRGIFQLTGKYNYNEFTNFYQKKYNSTKNFVADPGLVASDTEIAVISALWFFKTKVMSKVKIDKNTTVYKVTYYINPKFKGIGHRRALFKKTKTNIKCH